MDFNAWKREVNLVIQESSGSSCTSCRDDSATSKGG